MNKFRRFVFGSSVTMCGALVAALPAINTHADNVAVGVSVSTPHVQIGAVADFYEPLSPYGRWEVVGSYGRCWVPSRIAVGWVPYSTGYWQYTDMGWFWVSDEPWAWATYHYGAWAFDSHVGWYWVPRTQWAPAWVAWRQGGGYVGWAPLSPAGAAVSVNFVFVEERHFLEPVTPTKVIIKDTTIINKTTNISVTKVENNTMINEGPQLAAIEKAGGGKQIQKASVQELRTKEESKVAAKMKKEPAADKKGAAQQESVQTNREETTPDKKGGAPQEPVQTNREETPAEQAPAHEKATPAPKESQAPAPEKKAPTDKPDVKPAQPDTEKAAPPEQTKQDTGGTTKKEATTPQKTKKGSGKKTPPATEEPKEKNPK